MRFQPGQSGNPSGRPKGSVNHQLQQIRAACDAVLPLVLAKALGGDFEAQKFILERGLPKFKPVELPVEFSLEDGEAAPARAVLRQVAEGTLPVSSAQAILHELLPAAQQEAKALARKPPPSGGSFFNAYLNSVLGGEPPSAPKEKDAEVLALMAEVAGLCE